MAAKENMKLFLWLLSSLFVIEEAAGLDQLGCPPVDPNSFGACAMFCHPNDDDCPQGQTCCSNGCGYSCQTADKANDDWSAAVEPTEAAIRPWDLDCPKPEYTGSCSGDLCPVMKCSMKCCFDGCNSYCSATSRQTVAPSPTDDRCPMKNPSYGFGCTENKCTLMLCRKQCCYDGCKSYCYDDSAEPTPTNDQCPMKKPTFGFGCTENRCPVMLCYSQCCYDGCRSFCLGHAKPTTTNDYYDYYGDYTTTNDYGSGNYGDYGSGNYGDYGSGNYGDYTTTNDYGSGNYGDYGSGNYGDYGSGNYGDYGPVYVTAGADALHFNLASLAICLVHLYRCQ